jgi:hypothetical protein
VLGMTIYWGPRVSQATDSRSWVVRVSVIDEKNVPVSERRD